MHYGICHLNCVPVRKENSDTSEMVTQLLFGDHFKVLEKQKNWTRICITFDNYEGWIDTKQYTPLSEQDYTAYHKLSDRYLIDLVDFAYTQNQELTALSMGANLKASPLFQLQCDGQVASQKMPRKALIDIALNYINTPYLWGGKTPFGIDCSGFTQTIYKVAGYQLLRDASQQANQGEPLSFIEESQPGDLAFFDNAEGQITHVGLIIPDSFIIHAHGKVRIDRLDHTGIFNTDTKRYSHKLRVIKKIIND